MNSMFQRELILVALAGTIVVMGLGFIIPLFPIYVAEKGASNFELGLIVSGFTISQFFVQPFFGGLSDRHGRKIFIQYFNARYYDPRLAMFVQPDWWEVTRRDRDQPVQLLGERSGEPQRYLG